MEDDSPSDRSSAPLLSTPVTYSGGNGPKPNLMTTQQDLQCYQPDNNHSGAPKPLRIEVPICTGDAVDGWIFQMERYFEHNRVPYDQRMMIATFHMAGEALKWYQWLYTTHQVSTWFSFAQDVKLRFGPSEYCKPEVMLNLLHQTGTVATYISKFESLST
ncbi:hypothetical protein QQ045_016962 [Rhodiola kirilowii]